jgi:ABC-type glycerol-3-phosphate transport system permease component
MATPVIDVQTERPLPRPRHRAAARRVAGLAWRYALLTLTALVVLMPIYLAVVDSLQPVERLFSYPPALIVTDPQWQTYRLAFGVAPLGRYLLNSVLVTGLITAGQVTTSVLAAYAFTFIRFPLRTPLFMVFLATTMVPWEVTIISNYETVAALGWLDSYQGLAVPFLATAFGTFLLRQAFLTVPRELQEAAALDGCGHFAFMLRIVVPVSQPAIAALAVFSFLAAWNQYLWPLLITNQDAYRTVQIGLKSLVSQNMDQFNVVMAGSVIAAAPMFILLIAFQRHLVRSLVAGSLKG